MSGNDELPHYRGFGESNGGWGKPPRKHLVQHTGLVMMVVGVTLILLAIWVFWRTWKVGL